MTRTPEELKQLRINSLKKARAAKKANGKPAAKIAAAAPVAASKSDVPHEFVGITKSDCPAACTFERCVISGKPVCAHPNKGGLQSQHMLDQAAVERHGRAKKHLEHVKVDSRQ